MEKQIIATLLDYVILLADLNIITNKKHEYVRLQEFEKAAAMREEENKLIEELPSLEKLKSLREKFV